MITESQVVVIQGVPPSKSNQYKVGIMGGVNVKARATMYKSKELKAWEASFMEQIAKIPNPMLYTRFEISAWFYLTRPNADLDNPLKALLDCLQECKWIANDKDCWEVHLKKRVDAQNPRIKFQIRIYND